MVNKYQGFEVNAVKLDEVQKRAILDIERFFQEMRALLYGYRKESHVYTR